MFEPFFLKSSNQTQLLYKLQSAQKKNFKTSRVWVELGKADPTRLLTRTRHEVKRVWVRNFNPFN